MGETVGLPSVNSDRRHDLDALRGFAMLLGIGLHAAMAYTLIPWPVQDVSRNELLTVFFLVVHGFRMPLFFVVSGFFTAMLWKRKGTTHLLRHRLFRVLVPCLLGLLTIVPSVHWVVHWAMAKPASQATSTDLKTPAARLIDAMKRGDRSGIDLTLKEPVDVNARDNSFQVPLLAWAAMCGDAETIQILLDRGANIDAVTGDGSTAAQAAVFRGYPEVLQLLKQRGAKLDVKNRDGATPSDTLLANRGLTEYIANAIGLPVRDFADIEAGREKCRKLLPKSVRTSQIPTFLTDLEAPLKKTRAAYAAWLSSNRWQITWKTGATPFHLVLGEFFSHLWFLWFLWWIVLLFVVTVPLLSPLLESPLLKKAVLSPMRLLWLVPLTLLPQLWMGVLVPAFGPDTSTSIIPPPHLLTYYAIFFAFGVMYYFADDTNGIVGRRWDWNLTIALAVCFPVALMTMGNPLLTAIPQLGFTWLMIFACLGVFRRYASHPNNNIRYLSDAAYWLYLAHLPLVITAQHLVRNWPIHSTVKFALICGSVTALLLGTYEYGVRYTWLGALLNGRKSRPSRTSTSHQR